MADASYMYLIKRIEEILDIHGECLTRDGTQEQGCTMYGDLEWLVNDFYEATEQARLPRKPREISGPELVA